ncbi:MAG: protein TolR [Gammaproteobacteria bacterium]|nr:protein TolR [Gammaproteobacteria bacterium]
MADRKRRAVAEINVVPYIDVMLVLLIIFMITAPLLSQGVEIELPTADANPISPDQQEPLVVAVNKDGEYFINIGDKPDQAIDAQLMVNRVAAVLQLRPDTPVLVRGDKTVSYGKVVRAMVYLQQAGVAKVGLMTEGLN